MIVATSSPSIVMVWTHFKEAQIRSERNYVLLVERCSVARTPEDTFDPTCRIGVGSTGATVPLIFRQIRLGKLI